jgi:hypothetical protein
MKKIIFLISMIFILGFTQEVKAQDKKAICTYKPVGSNNLYEGIIYYNIDKSGEPYLVSYSIPDIENGNGEFYNRKEYPSYASEKIDGVTYKYSMPINGAGMAYFNMVCEKCR